MLLLLVAASCAHSAPASARLAAPGRDATGDAGAHRDARSTGHARRTRDAATHNCRGIGTERNDSDSGTASCRQRLPRRRLRGRLQPLRQRRSRTAPHRPSQRRSPRHHALRPHRQLLHHPLLHHHCCLPAPVASPTLDLNALKEQLKETKAIGVFTKISLKNQVDDLMKQFREYYQGKTKLSLKQLRQSYDLLLMKVLSLLQDTDKKLASAIVSSREAIWGLLSDQKKFDALEI
jgi:hypothetical protein